jgi:hypothetical protein
LAIELKSNRKIITPILVLPLVLAIIMGATILLPFQSLNAQNATSSQNATAQSQSAPIIDQVNSTVLQTLAQPGYNNVHNVTDKDGNTHPISYNIERGTVVGISGDPQRHALFVNVNPGSAVGAAAAAEGNSTPSTTASAPRTEEEEEAREEAQDREEEAREEEGALEIGLPRNVLDSVDSVGTDSDFVVLIDGQQVSEASASCFGYCPYMAGSFKETETTDTDRVLTVLFNPQSRVIEIVGNQGVLF